jgi:hypothetical protein
MVRMQEQRDSLVRFTSWNGGAESFARLEKDKTVGRGWWVNHGRANGGGSHAFMKYVEDQVNYKFAPIFLLLWNPEVGEAI